MRQPRRRCLVDLVSGESNMPSILKELALRRTTRIVRGFGDADFVPTHVAPMTTALLEAASDDWFADRNEDGIPDLAIGRLPARTVAEAHNAGKPVAPVKPLKD